MNNNNHLVNAQLLSRLISQGKTFSDQQILVREWAREMRLALKTAQRSAKAVV